MEIDMIKEAFKIAGMIVGAAVVYTTIVTIGFYIFS